MQKTMQATREIMIRQSVNGTKRERKNATASASASAPAVCVCVYERLQQAKTTTITQNINTEQHIVSFFFFFFLAFILFASFIPFESVSALIFDISLPFDIGERDTFQIQSSNRFARIFSPRLTSFFLLSASSLLLRLLLFSLLILSHSLYNAIGCHQLSATQHTHPLSVCSDISMEIGNI